MADIRTSSFWLDLLKKIFKSILRRKGISTTKQTHNQHVVPFEDGWAVRGEGNERITASYNYQEDAIDRAKEIAKNYQSSVIIHRKDGTIRDRINF
ncbi:MAG: DUF2188 domain-containing protein [Flavobacteriales bacterium]|nr:DUF2188 domain-containing protein [Flavobacteriales bacterium]